MATNKLLWSSKIIGVFFMMLVCTLSANAQFLRTSYFMEGTHYRQQLNPALTPTKGYFNLPVIGAVNATVGSTSLGYQDIIDIIDDGDDFYKSTRQHFFSLNRTILGLSVTKSCLFCKKM